MLKEFKEFAIQGNVIDLAVGVIIGGAFGKIITSLVDDVVMPPIGKLLGGVDFNNLYLNLSDQTYESFAKAKAAGAPVIGYGAFLNTLVQFLIIAFIIFLIVRAINRLKRAKAAEPAPPSAQEVLLTEIRDLLKTR